MNQLDMIKKLATIAKKSDALIVSEIGSQSCWLHTAMDSKRHLYLSGPMGMAPSVALGVAIANPQRPVLALCGDGATVMNFSSLVTASAMAPENLTIALMDNQVYAFTGEVYCPSQGVDWLNTIAGLPGFEHSAPINVESELTLSSSAGLSFWHAEVGMVENETMTPCKLPPLAIHRRFKAHVTK